MILQLHLFKKMTTSSNKNILTRQKIVGRKIFLVANTHYDGKFNITINTFVVDC